MPHYIINGLFMTQQVVGAQRYAYELCLALDDLLENKKMVMLVPSSYNVKNAPFKNIKIISYGKHKGILWEQTDLRRYARKNDVSCINFCNVTPLLIKPGITAVHDLMFKQFPEWYTTVRNKLSCIWHTFQAGYALKNERWILCTSNFTKQVLEEAYPCAIGKVVVIPVAWQHVKRFKDNPLWQKKYPYLVKNNFFFSMATRAKNKNGKWIFEAARNNPNQTFVIAGKSYEQEAYDKPDNLYLLGYISDEDACSLMKNCRAFICPSLYEGFGVPPLEALALGAKIIVSNTSALPEVYEKSAYYIDPYNSNIDIEALLQNEVASPEYILSKYSWEKSARILYDLVFPNIDE